MSRTPINIRNYSDEDEKAIDECSKLFKTSVRTKTVIRAVHEYLKLKKSIDDIGNIIRQCD